MRLLAIDTTAHFGSIALQQNGELLEEMLIHSPQGFGGILFDHIGKLLARHGTRVSEVDCFASATGPGSFTGVRMGLTAVKGLAEATGRPAIGVSNLKALAACGSHAIRAAVLDARRGEIYGAVYDSALQPLREEQVLPFQIWLTHIPAGDVEFLSTDFAPFQAAMTGTAFENAPVTQQRALAAAVARVAARQFELGEWEDPAGLDANYIRRSDAELLSGL